MLTKPRVQSSRLHGLYLRNMLTFKRLNAGGYIGSVIGTQPCLTHIATPPGKHSSLLAYNQSMLTTTHYLMQQQAFLTFVLSNQLPESELGKSAVKVWYVSPLQFHTAEKHGSVWRRSKRSNSVGKMDCLGNTALPENVQQDVDVHEQTCRPLLATLSCLFVPQLTWTELT